ncbi:MAG: M14 family zinc carboxypeptidase [Solirubrobacteraceae bacterium]
MPRLTLLTLGIAAALIMAAPAAAATSPPAVSRTITAPERGSCATTTYRAPLTGYLDVRLRGSGDWDLELRSAGGTTLATSRGFGGREVGQAWVRGGQRIIARGCRGRGAGTRARTTFRLASITPPKLALGAAQLLRVHGSEQQLQALERVGLDVTHAAGRGWADVIVSGAAQLATVVASGLRHSVRIADLSKSYAQAREADRRYATRSSAASTPLPSGRTSYRTHDDVQTELKALVDQNAGLVRKVVFGTSYQGREISGIEIARNVGADDGRPVFFLMALHHAREWPSMEAAMEFAQMLVSERRNGRIADLLARERIVILPLVNPDGFISSRGAFDPGDALAAQDPNVTLLESIAPPGGLAAYRRKNCNGELTPALPCELAWGVDPNRNYGELWGGPGSSSDVTSQTYHGPGPRSESEVQAVWNYVRSHHVTTLVTVHNVAALVLRPPGTSAAGPAPDEARMKAIGDRMGSAAGYASQFGFELYDTTGTTEDDSYAATGGYGYTIEMGPPGGNFHMPYQTGVVAEWTGENPHAQSRGGLREALLIAAGSAAENADHAILRGSAPPGRILRLHKRFQTQTSPYCEKGVEPVVDIGLPRICLTGLKAPLTLDDELDATTTVPSGGSYAWHIGQSTRPFVGALAGRKEAYTLTCEEPGGRVLEHLALVIDRGQAVTLDIGCGAGPTTFSNGAPVGGDPAAPAGSTAPAVNGVPVPPEVAAAKKKKTVASKRARRLSSCVKRAKRVKSAKRRQVKRKSCARRFANKAPAKKAPAKNKSP